MCGVFLSGFGSIDFVGFSGCCCCFFVVCLCLYEFLV